MELIEKKNENNINNNSGRIIKECNLFIYSFSFSYGLYCNAEINDNYHMMLEGLDSKYFIFVVV